MYSKNIVGLGGIGVIKVTPNYSKRTFTIRKNGIKYRTGKFSIDEFEELEMNTNNDWVNWMKRENYYSKV
jgi:hypothetical protein